MFLKQSSYLYGKWNFLPSSQGRCPTFFVLDERCIVFLIFKITPLLLDRGIAAEGAQR